MQTWMTIAAQIFNFLVLVVALYYLLYGPITRAMGEREQRIADRMHDASRREEEAEEQARRYREQCRELADSRDEMLQQARKEAQTERERLVQEAREQIEGMERSWHQNLRDQRASFFRELRKRMGRELCAVARRALADLATADLQAQIVHVFIDRLQDLDDASRGQIREALEQAVHPPRVVSAFELPHDQRRAIAAAARELLGTDGQIDFRRSDELLCGLELNVGGRKVAWSLDSYLDSLEQSIAETLEREVRAEERQEAPMPRTQVGPQHREEHGHAEAE